jgi:tetratricopeptide (TPR) repeat protein
MKAIHWLSIVLLSAMAASATGVKIAGTLTTKNGKPIINASVNLVKAKLSGTTDEDGMFGVYGNVGVISPGISALATRPIVNGNAVIFSVGKSCSQVKLDVFNAGGARIFSTAVRNPSPGVNRLEIKPSGYSWGNGLALIRLAIDNKIQVLTANTLALKSAPASAIVAAKASDLAKNTNAAIDTLKISATGYKTAMVPIATYQLPAINLSLDTGLTVVIDTSKTTSKQDFLAIAQRYRDLYYGQCYGAEKLTVDSALFTLEVKEPFLSAAAGKLSTAALILMGKGLALHASVVFAAAAAQTSPDSADIVNNFGAVVRMLDKDSDAVTVLLYANKLYPGAPVVLTNLANTLLEMGDDSKAEAYYRKALMTNSQYGPAHQGLGTLYLKRMDYIAAVNEFFAAAEFAFMGTTSKAISSAKSQCGGTPDQPFGQGTGDAAGTSDPSNPDQSSLAPDHQLFIPPYPRWNGIDQFVLDNDGLKRWNDNVSGGMGGCLTWALNLADKVKNMDSTAKAKFSNQILLYQREIIGEQYLAAYFTDRINDGNSQDSAALAALDKALKTSLDLYDAALTSQLAAHEADKPNPADLAAVWAWDQKSLEITAANNALRVVAWDDYFGKWAVIQRKSYTSTKQKLEEFWLYTEPFMKQLFCGGLVYQMVDNSRRSFVYTQLYKYTGALPMLSLGYAGAYETAKGLAQLMPDQTPPEKIDSTKVPETGGGEGPPCPFKNSEFVAGAGPVSITINCESVEVEGGEGIIGAAKYNFKKKETTLFLGVGFEARLGAKSLGGDVAAKAGGFVTFDQNNNVTDGGIKSDITAGAHVGAGTLSTKVEFTGSAVTGPDVEIGIQAGVKP